MKRLIVVGGMNLDLLGVPAGPLLPRDSNPGKITLRPGGVGRNIAEKLAKAMSYMYDHPDEADRMGKNAYLIREKRRPDRIAKKWDRLIYKTVSPDDV